MKTMLVFVVLVAVASARSIQHFNSLQEALEHEKSKYDFEANHDLDMHHFNNFKSEHNKQYASREEELKRFAIFRVNLLKIKLLNMFDSGSATYAVNHFADLEENEFLATYAGAKLDRKQVESEVDFAEAEFDRNAELPKEVDWREKGAVTDVKNQGQCGSCWAFAAVASVESQNQLVNGELLRLSEQQLVDCDTTSQGCSGGFMSWAYESIMKLGGIVSEKDYPYTARDGECSFDKNLAKVKVQNYVNLTHNEEEIAQYVSQKGPVALGINASLMQFYNGGIAHPNFITRWLCNPSGLNHGVTIVGFGEAKKRGKPEPYWIIKNSWGPKWGRQGYYYIHRGSNACGVAEFVTGPVVVKK